MPTQACRSPKHVERELSVEPCRQLDVIQRDPFVRCVDQRRSLEDDPQRNLRRVWQMGLRSLWIRRPAQSGETDTLLIGTQVGVFHESLLTRLTISDTEWQALTTRTVGLLAALGYEDAPALHVLWDPEYSPLPEGKPPPRPSNQA